MMFELTGTSTEQYKDLGVFTESSGIEVAPHPRTDAGGSSGASPRPRPRASPLSTHPGKRPEAPCRTWIPSVILGGAYCPTVGVVDSLRAGTLMREKAQAAGALTVLSGTEVLDTTTDPAHRPEGASESSQAAVTSIGEIETGNVEICCGVWSPRVARLAGRGSRSAPIVHQMISVGPIGLLRRHDRRDLLPHRP